MKQLCRPIMAEVHMGDGISIWVSAWSGPGLVTVGRRNLLNSDGNRKLEAWAVAIFLGKNQYEGPSDEAKVLLCLPLWFRVRELCLVRLINSHVWCSWHELGCPYVQVLLILFEKLAHTIIYQLVPMVMPGRWWLFISIKKDLNHPTLDDSKRFFSKWSRPWQPILLQNGVTQSQYRLQAAILYTQ